MHKYLITYVAILAVSVLGTFGLNGPHNRAKIGMQRGKHSIWRKAFIKEEFYALCYYEVKAFYSDPSRKTIKSAVELNLLFMLPNLQDCRINCIQQREMASKLPPIRNTNLAFLRGLMRFRIAHKRFMKP